MTNLAKARARALGIQHIQFLVPLVSMFLLTPLLLHQLGAEAYGLLAAIASTTAFLNTADLGMSSAVPRLVAMHGARQEREEVSQVVSSTTALFIITAIVLLLLMPWLTRLIVGLVKIDSHFVTTGTTVATVALLSVMVSLLAAPLSGLLNGIHRLDLVGLAGLSGLVIASVLSAIAAVKGFGIVGVQTARTLGVMITAILIVTFVYKTAPKGIFQLRNANLTTVRKVLSISIPLFVVGMGHVALFYTDNILIVRLFGPSFVAGYAVAFQLIAVSLQLVFLTGGILIPLFSEAYGRDDFISLRFLYLRYTRVTLTTSSFLFGGLLLFGTRFVVLWTGNSVLISVGLIPILAVLVLIRGLTHPASVLLTSIGEQRAMARYQLAEAVVNLGFSLLLAHYIGLVGIALGSVVAQAATSLLLAPALARKRLFITGREYGRLILPTSVITFVSIAITSVLLVDNSADLGSFILIILFYIAVFFGLLWRFSLSNGEKRQVVLMFSTHVVGFIKGSDIGGRL